MRPTQVKDIGCEKINWQKNPIVPNIHFFENYSRICAAKSLDSDADRGNNGRQNGEIGQFFKAIDQKPITISIYSCAYG